MSCIDDDSMESINSVELGDSLPKVLLFFWSLCIDTCIFKIAFPYIASESGSSDSSPHMPSLSNTPSTSGTLTMVNTDPFSLLYRFLSLSIQPCLRPWTNFFHIPFLKKSIHTYMRSTAHYSFTYFFPCSLLSKRNQYIHTCDPQLVTPLHTFFHVPFFLKEINTYIHAIHSLLLLYILFFFSVACYLLHKVWRHVRADQLLYILCL